MEYVVTEVFGEPGMSLLRYLVNGVCGYRGTQRLRYVICDDLHMS